MKTNETNPVAPTGAASAAPTAPAAPAKAAPKRAPKAAPTPVTATPAAAAPVNAGKSLTAQLGDFFDGNPPSNEPVAAVPAETDPEDPGAEPLPGNEGEVVDDGLSPNSETQGQEQEHEQEQDGEEAIPDGLAPGVRKQLFELRKDRRELREELQQIRQELETERTQREEAANAPSANAAPTNAGPLGTIWDGAGLQQHAAEAQGHLESVEDMLVAVRRRPEQVAKQLKSAGVTLPVDDATGEADTSAEALEETLLGLKRGLTKRLNRDIPQRQAFLKQSAEWTTRAKAEAPWLADAKSPERAQVLKFVQSPEVMSRPDRFWLGACFVEGSKVLAARVAAGKSKTEPNPAPGTRRAPASAPRGGPAPARVNTQAVRMTQANEAVAKKQPGGVEALLAAQLDATGFK